jgi:hypothetical protein
MKYKNEEIRNINHLAKVLILQSLVGLEDKVHQDNFGSLDIRSGIARKVLKETEGFEVSDLEADLLLRTLKFEIAKVIGKLENQTGLNTNTVVRTRQGYVSKQGYGL